MQRPPFQEVKPSTVSSQTDSQEEMLRRGKEEFDAFRRKQYLAYFTSINNRQEAEFVSQEDEDDFLRKASPAVKAYLRKNENFVQRPVYSIEIDTQIGKKKTSPAMTILSNRKLEAVDLSAYIKTAADADGAAAIERMLKKYNLETIKLGAYWEGEGEERDFHLVYHGTSGSDKAAVRAREHAFICEFMEIIFTEHPYLRERGIPLRGDIQVNGMETLEDGVTLAEGKNEDGTPNGRMTLSSEMRELVDNKKTGFGRFSLVSAKLADEARRKMRAGTFGKNKQQEKVFLDDPDTKTGVLIFKPRDQGDVTLNSQFFANYSFPPIGAVKNAVTDPIIGDHPLVQHDAEEKETKKRMFSNGGMSQKKPKRFRSVKEIHSDDAFIVDKQGNLELKPEVTRADTEMTHAYYKLLVPKLAQIEFKNPDAVPLANKKALAAKGKETPPTNKEYLDEFQGVLRELGIEAKGDMANFDFSNGEKRRKLSNAIDMFLIAQAIDGAEDFAPELTAAYRSFMGEYLRSKEFQDYMKYDRRQRFPTADKITDAHVKDAIDTSNKTTDGGSGKAPVNQFVKFVIDGEDLGGFPAIGGKTVKTPEEVIDDQCYLQASAIADALIDGIDEVSIVSTETSTTELGFGDKEKNVIGLRFRETAELFQNLYLGAGNRLDFIERQQQNAERLYQREFSLGSAMASHGTFSSAAGQPTEAAPTVQAQREYSRLGR